MVLLRWFAYDTEFVPNKTDNRFKRWTTKGLTAYWTFMNKGDLQSFHMLKGNHRLENQDFYRYLQLRHYLEHAILFKGIIKGFFSFFFLAYQLDVCTNIG